MAVQRDKVIASAEKLVAKGKIEPAIKEYERLLDDNPNDVNTLNRIGDLWVRINRNDEAVKVFTKIADHYSKDGFFLKAIAIYKKINKLDPSKLEVYARLADLYAKQGLAMEAKSQYQVLADYYLKHGDPGNALAIYRKISELDPNSINVHVKLADLYSQNNQTGEALKEYDRVGRMLLKRGMLEEAVQVFRKALKIDARNVELVESLVTALIEAKDYKNAVDIVEAALSSNADNPRLLAALGKIHVARGDQMAARVALERGLAADPGDTAVRETLADFALRQGNADKALEMVGPLVEKALARGERAAAVEVINRVLRVDPGHTPTLERLVALYQRLNEETNVLAAMNSLAEAHISKGQYERAAGVLEKLIQREPQNSQHRTKLTFVRSQMGGIDTMPVRPRTYNDPLPPPPSMSLEVDEPPPSFDTSEEPSLDLDASAPLELDLSMDDAPVAAVPVAPVAPPPPTRLDSAVDLAAAELAGEAGDDLDFITEHLTEAEVFAKYGLAEKAAEHLRAIIERAPKHLVAYERLYRIVLDEGDVEGARALATQYVNLLQEKGDDQAISAVVNEFMARGLTLAAPAKPKTPTVAKPMPVPPPPPPALEEEDVEELSFDLEPEPEPEEVEMSLEPEPEPEPVSAMGEIAEEPEELIDFSMEEPEQTLTLEPEEETLTLEPEAEPSFSFDEPSFEMETPSFELETPSFETPSFETPSFETPSFETPSFETPSFETPSFEVPAPEPELSTFDPETAFAGPASSEPTVGEPFFGVEALGNAVDSPAPDELGEIDFYIEQELLEVARDKVSTLLSRYPDNPELEERVERIARAAAASTPLPPPTPPPPALSRDEIESELLSAIPDDDDFDLSADEEEEPAAALAPPPPAPAPPPPPAPSFAASSVEEQNLFADEDDFFDLAAELESELEDDTEVVSLSEEEQSLEEIFKEFKKGVEQQLDSEDYDTHYNLGIAYKEMGLIDEAIGEFQLASKDPKRAVECASMLGLCFLEKGMPQLAIKWYRKGLEMPEITEEEHVGLLYDLGSAYMEVGDTENAQKAFVEVYGLNTNYRDIVSRIKQLEDAKR